MVLALCAMLDGLTIPDTPADRRAHRHYPPERFCGDCFNLQHAQKKLNILQLCQQASLKVKQSLKLRKSVSAVAHYLKVFSKLFYLILHVTYRKNPKLTLKQATISRNWPNEFIAVPIISLLRWLVTEDSELFHPSAGVLIWSRTIHTHCWFQYEIGILHVSDPADADTVQCWSGLFKLPALGDKARSPPSTVAQSVVTVK